MRMSVLFGTSDWQQGFVVEETAFFYIWERSTDGRIFSIAKNVNPDTYLIG